MKLLVTWLLNSPSLALQLKETGLLISGSVCHPWPLTTADAWCWLLSAMLWLCYAVMEFTMGITAPPGYEGPQIKGWWEEEAHTLYIYIFSKRHCNFIHINTLLCYLISDQISHSVMSNSFRPHESQHARLPCPSPTLAVHWDSCPLSQ